MCLARYGRRVSKFCSRTSVHGVLLALLLLSSTTGTAGQRWLHEPTDRNITVGGNVTFPCEAEGVDNYTHIWSKGSLPVFVNGVPSKNVPSRYRIEGKNTLVITGVTLEDDSTYSCTIFQFDSIEVKLNIQLPPGPPSISVNSSSSQLVEKSVISLTCSSRGGKPAPTFRWLRNGQLVDSAINTPPPQGDPLGTSSSQISVTLTRQDHRANYSCIVFNAATINSPTVSTKILNVQYSPSIKVDPTFNPYLVKQGSNVKLMCIIDSNPRHSTVTWKKDGAIIASNQETLNLNSIQKSNSGKYTCTATNNILGTVHTSTSDTTVDVIYAPTVTTESVIIVNISTPVNMTCIVDANPPARSVSWQKLDGPISSPGPSFNFMAQLRYDGNYSCTAVSRLTPSGQPAEDISSKGYTTVKVQYPPGQASITLAKAVLVGQRIVLTCSVDQPGYPRPKYEWRRLGSPNPLQSTSSPQYTINRATLADNGNYTCTPRNIMGLGSPAAVEVVVNSAPEFISSSPVQPVMSVSINHTNLLMEHKIEGRPLPAVEWLKDGIPVSVMNKLYQVETTNIIVEQYKYRVTTRLTFLGSDRDMTSLRIEDMGNYTCQVTSTATNVPVERSIFLSIQFKPLILEHHRVASRLSGTARLRCKVQGNPAPSVTWYRQGIRIDNGPKYYFSLKKVGGIETYESALEVRKVAETDFGEFLCESSNTKGTTSEKIVLSPIGKPDPPTNVASIGKSWESVMLKWEPGFDGGYAQSFFIAVRSVYGERIAEVRPSTATEFNVTRLMPYTSYTFQVFGQNNAGQGRYSAGFTTQTGLLSFPPLKEIPEYRVEDRQIQVPNELNHSYCLRIDVSTDNGKVWNVIEPCVMALEGNVPLSVQSATNVNVSICLVYRPEVCGEPVMSAIHEGSTPDLSPEDVYIIGGVCAAILIILLIILVVIIYRRQKRKNRTYRTRSCGMDSPDEKELSAKFNFTNDPHSPRTVQQGNGALPNQKPHVFDNPGMGRELMLSHGSHSNMGTLTRTNTTPNGRATNMPDIAVNNISYGVPLDNRNGYHQQYLQYGENFPMEDTSYDSHTFGNYEYEMNRRNANISDPYYEKQQQGDLSFSGSPRTPTKDPQQFISVPEDSKNEGGSFGSGHESGYSTPDPAKPKKAWTFRPNIFQFRHATPKQKGKNKKTNPDMVPYSHDPPGHTCGLPCCSEDLQIQLRVRRQPRSCIGIQEHDVIQQNFTFKGRLRHKPSLENGFYSVQQSRDIKRKEIPKFGSVGKTLSTIKEEQKNYHFLKGRGITLPESKDPEATEKVYLQGFNAGESDDILDVDSDSEIEYYMTFKGPSDRGVPYSKEGLDMTALYPWDLLKEIRDKGKSGEKSDDSSSSNYYEVLRYPEEPQVQAENTKQNTGNQSEHLAPPDLPPKLPKQNMFNHPPLSKGVRDNQKPKPEVTPVQFPYLEQSTTPTKYNTYNSVHSINSMANQSSKEVYERYLSLSRSQQTNKPLYRDTRDIDFTGSDNLHKGRKFNTLDKILQRNDNSTDSLDKNVTIDDMKKPVKQINSEPQNEPMDKTILIQEDLDDEDDEGFTNEGFRNIYIDGKHLGSRTSISSQDVDKVYHRSLKHGEIDGDMLSKVINAAGFTDAGMKYFHIDDIDSNKDAVKVTLSDNPITLIL